MYVLDTNTLIYYFKGQGQVAQNLATLITHNVNEFSRVSGLAIADWY